MQTDENRNAYNVKYVKGFMAMMIKNRGRFAFAVSLSEDGHIDCNMALDTLSLEELENAVDELYKHWKEDIRKGTVRRKI